MAGRRAFAFQCHGITFRVIVSGMIVDGDSLPALSSDGGEISTLQSWLEEADMRFVQHINYSVMVENVKRVLVDSNDADSFTYLLKYTPPV